MGKFQYPLRVNSLSSRSPSAAARPCSRFQYPLRVNSLSSQRGAVFQALAVEFQYPLRVNSLSSPAPLTPLVSRAAVSVPSTGQ